MTRSRRTARLRAAAALLSLPGLTGLAVASGSAGVSLLEATSALALLGGFSLAVWRRLELLSQ